MKSKLFSSLLGLLILVGISYVCAYSTSADTSRNQYITTADASTNNSVLSNGTYNVHAYVSYGSTRAGSFGNQHVAMNASDHGSTSQSASASAFVGGYDSSGQYQSSSSNSYLPGN